MNRYLIQRKLHRPYATWRTLSAAHNEREARRVYLHAVASISERSGTVRLWDAEEGGTLEWTSRGMVGSVDAALAAKGDV